MVVCQPNRVQIGRPQLLCTAIIRCILWPVQANELGSLASIKDFCALFAAAICLALSVFVLGLAPLAASIPGIFVRIDAPALARIPDRAPRPKILTKTARLLDSTKMQTACSTASCGTRTARLLPSMRQGTSKVADLGTSPQSINNHGEIVGYYVTNPNAVRHGFVRHKNGTFTTIDPAGSFGTVVQSINAEGNITGNYVAADSVRAFLQTKDGTFTPFDPPNSYNTAPQRIKESNEIVGYFGDVNDALHGFLRHNDGTFETFEAPGASTGEGVGTFAMDVNAAGRSRGITIPAHTKDFMVLSGARTARSSPSILRELSRITRRIRTLTGTWFGLLPVP